MPGVYRPSTWVDILRTLNGSSQSAADTTTSGIGYFAEADETVACADAATTLVAVNLGWDQAQWGALAWG